MVRNPPAVQETRVPSLGWGAPLGEGTETVFLPGKAHGQRSLAGYSSQGRRESDTAQQQPQPVAGAESGFRGPGWLLDLRQRLEQSGDACAAQERKFPTQSKTLTSLM